MRRTVPLGFVALAIALASPRAASPIRAMILDGESAGAYHQWRLTTPVLKKTLEETALFAVDVVTAPMALESVSGFAPCQAPTRGWLGGSPGEAQPASRSVSARHRFIVLAIPR